ncbi:MAG: hypothetical protein P1U56_01540 [Saprospiraceae bacterium]|nr:hypothetical protein [Saprospiraceae bacterium]
MRLILSLLFSLYFITPNFSQAKFESGYFINSDGEKLNCLIKNNDWKDNPERIEFKLDSVGAIQSVSTNAISEFSIYNTCKYQKHTVIIDKSNEVKKDRYDLKQTDYQEETILLKVLVEGKATLYVFENSNFKRYFFSLDQSKPEQLVYSSFRRYSNGPRLSEVKNTKLEYNRYFRIQLFDNLVCKGITNEMVLKTKFKKNSLSDLFHLYNTCIGSSSINFDDTRNRELIQFRTRLGFGNTNIKALNGIISSFNFSNKLSFRLGYEVEYILPYANSQWSLTIEPTFVKIYFSDSISTISSAKFNINTIQLPIGLRYNHILSKETKLYGTILHAPEFAFRSTIDRGTSQVYNVNSANNFLLRDYAFGVGIVNNKWNIELRHHTKRAIQVSLGPDLKYGVTYLILGYKFR